MTALWQTRLATGLSQTANAGAALMSVAARPDVLPRLRFVLYGLLAVWMVSSLWRAAWSFFPEAPALPAVNIINPMNNSVAQLARPGVDIDALAASHLFGEPGESAPDVLGAEAAAAAAAAEAEAASALAGIEDGAPESRLPLALRGVVAATDAGLGQAVIEHNNQQELYQVGDDMPVSGDVVLAKVLPEMVVLDNGGRYELLKLFEESSLSRSTAVPAAPTQATPRPREIASSMAEDEDHEGEQDASAVASRYRERLYENPESLVDVVRVSAVREGQELRGYRVAPGRAVEAFSALGFEAGDLVTGINGLSLSDPANTMRLYQTMRTATSASFELERDGQPITLSVNLEENGS